MYSPFGATLRAAGRDIVIRVAPQVSCYQQSLEKLFCVLGVMDLFGW